MARARLIKVLLIVVLFIILIPFALPQGPNIHIGKWRRDLRLRKGLDLVGGAHLVYQLDVKNFKGQPDEALDQVVETMRLRVDALGVSEPLIQKSSLSGAPAVIVELPGISDTATARSTIGDTAQLSFLTGDGGVVITGSNVDKASVVFDQNTNRPEVQLKLNKEGGDAFQKATAANIGKPIYIILDNQIISAPTVQTEISGGVAVITGVGGTLSQTDAVLAAKKLATQINSGALPVPVELVGEETVGATLGQSTVQSSIFAGVVGFLAIFLFMILTYGFAGVVATFTLCIYLALMLFIIKFIPITLTLAGIAGLILSLGVTVDANVLVFARIKDERRAGSEMALAVRNGFARAWPSIRDANISSSITALILFWFGTGPIRGFAVILLTGIIVGIYCAVTLNRIFMEWLARGRSANKLVRS